MREKKFEQKYSAAHNMVQAYEQLKELRDLLAIAKDAEQFIQSKDAEIAKLNNEIEGLRNHEENLKATILKLREDERKEREEHKAQLKAIEEEHKRKTRLETDNAIREVKKQTENAENKKNNLERTIVQRQDYLDTLEGKIRMREQHLSAIHEQIDKLKETLN